MEDDCEIVIEPVQEKVMTSEEVSAPRLSDILVERDDIDRKTLDEEFGAQKKTGEQLVASGALSKEKLKSALV